MLATAESCTGGLLAKCLTDLPGSSEWFKGGVVAYHNQIKEELLKVPRQLLEGFGAVSKEVALAMANGAREVLGSQYAIATTGIAGPAGGTAEKPVGTVWIAVSSSRGAEAVLLELRGSRDEIRVETVEKALRLLLCKLRNDLCQE